MENLFHTDLLLELLVKQVSFRRMGFRGTKIAPATVNSNRKSSREKKTLAQRVNEVCSVTVESKVNRGLVLKAPDQKTD